MVEVASQPPSLDAVLALAGTVLASSVLGSAHCAGMCGGLALAASGPMGAKDGSRTMRQAGYHVGRLVSYAVVGAIAGLVGAAVDDAGTLVGVQRVAAIVAGSMIALMGVIAIARAVGLRVPAASVPMPMVRMAQRVHAATLRLPPNARGLPLGLATPLLPCGWLYAFAAIAAASASMPLGAFVMAAFWLGTVPAVVVASNGARIAFARLGRAAPVVAGIAMIAVGLHAAVVRGGAAERAMHEVRGSQVQGVSVVELSNRAEAQAGELPPCCREAKQ
jgi:sulfite exporter TauE/SafE